MATSGRLASSASITSKRSHEVAATVPDPAWRSLYRIGGISAFLYILVGLAIPGILVASVDLYERGSNGAVLLAFIDEHRMWWIVLQTLMLGVSSCLAIIVFMALFAALKGVGNVAAATGALFGVVSQILFIAYIPITMGIVFLAEQYPAASPERRTSLGAAEEALIAVIDAFNPFYEVIFALSIMAVSLAMLRGIFARWVAWLGVSTPVAAAIGFGLWPLVGVAYFWWWLIVVVWLIAVGWRLYQLGGTS